MPKQMKPGSQGISSNKNVSPPVRTGKGNYGVNPGYPAQLGNKIGAHSTDRGDLRPRPEQMATKALQSPQLGNAVAGNVGKGGPGAGRMIHRSGSQMQHGPVHPGEGSIAASTADRGPRSILNEPKRR